jgi:N-acetylglucosaminyldiphosphoundecaprenol N-acetyl-beta-D-mannosaminyltransferase
MMSDLFSPKVPTAAAGEPASATVLYERIAGMRFHSLRLPDVIAWIDRAIERRVPVQITLANAYTFTMCHRWEKLMQIINGSDLTLADGMSIVWGARWLGIRLPGRIAGPDLMQTLCAHSEKAGHGIFLMGSSPENLLCLTNVLRARWPRLRIVGTHSPSMCDRFDEAETLRILAEIKAVEADILFVGVSAPKQEIWISENLHRLNVPVAIGVGAAFDFLSGRIPRAPQALQRVGLEWLYRLWKEPRR